MTDMLLPISSSGPASGARDVLMGGARSVMSVRPQGVESAAALRPVDPSALAKDIRLQSTRDLPVGPPPTFEINVLEHLHASLFKTEKAPAAPDENTAPENEVAGTSEETAQLGAAVSFETRYASDGVSFGQDPALNKVV